MFARGYLVECWQEGYPVTVRLGREAGEGSHGTAVGRHKLSVQSIGALVTEAARQDRDKPACGDGAEDRTDVDGRPATMFLCKSLL